MGREILVSACLLGEACRYDGRSKEHGSVQRRVAALREGGARVVPVCPEELGGLGTPRPAAELSGGVGRGVWGGEATVRVKTTGADVSEAFRAGARLARAEAPAAREAILKARSPSCGVGRTWCGGELVNGDGVFAALLRSQGVDLSTEEDDQRGE